MGQQALKNLSDTPLPKPTKEYAYSRIDMLTFREDPHTRERAPWSCKYVTKQGEIITLHNIVTTSIDRQRGIRRVKLLGTQDASKNAMTRTLRDCLILQVDEYRIVKT